MTGQRQVIPHEGDYIRRMEVAWPHSFEAAMSLIDGLSGVKRFDLVHIYLTDRRVQRRIDDRNRLLGVLGVLDVVTCIIEHDEVTLDPTSITPKGKTFHDFHFPLSYPSLQQHSQLWLRTVTLPKDGFVGEYYSLEPVIQDATHQTGADPFAHLTRAARLEMDLRSASHTD